MSTLINYKKLTEKELWLLILADDRKAIEEHLRRIKSGELKPTRSYSLKQMEKLARRSSRKAS